LERLILTFVLAILGGGIGYLAQRSRMCFVAGFRDYFIVRDRELLLGIFSFIATIWLLTSVFQPLNMIRSGIPQYGDAVIRRSVEHVRFSLSHVMNIRNFIAGKQGEAADLSAHFLNKFIYVTFAGGLLIGLVSTLAGGCVLRQHVLLAQGSMNALYYIAGFYIAVVVYYLFLFRFLVKLY